MGGAGGAGGGGLLDMGMGGMGMPAQSNSIDLMGGMGFGGAPA